MTANEIQNSCIFCKIIKGTLPGNKVYSDDLCTAFLDIHPINPGHVLVVPNRHTERCLDLETVEAERLFGVAQKIYRALRSTNIKCEGANFFLSDGAVAGQEVGHSHLHIAPRFKGDGQHLGFSHSLPKEPNENEPEALDIVASKIRTRMSIA